ncbi:MAG: hypothetical protein VX346_07815 [Planctomycetota bacterium]|nr:hypothetical protein [Planctomycetota bacterium]
MAITDSQRRLLIVTASLVLLRGLFPPAGGRDGFTFFLGLRADINGGALLAEAMILFGATTLLFIWMRGSSPADQAEAKAKRQHRKARRQDRVEQRKHKARHQTKLSQLQSQRDSQQQVEDETSGSAPERLDFTGIDPSKTDSSS